MGVNTLIVRNTAHAHDIACATPGKAPPWHTEGHVFEAGIASDPARCVQSSSHHLSYIPHLSPAIAVVSGSAHNDGALSVQPGRI